MPKHTRAHVHVADHKTEYRVNPTVLVPTCSCGAIFFQDRWRKPKAKRSLFDQVWRAVMKKVFKSRHADSDHTT